MWSHALIHLTDCNVGTYGPESFQDYLLRNKLGRKPTAPSISIDCYEKLPKQLRDNDTMVLRLGASNHGTGTQFILAKVKDRLKDFFLVNDEVFRMSQPDIFHPKKNLNSLKGYKIMPVLSETSLVNLALTSGLLSEALSFDVKMVPGAPTTGKSTFSFKFKVHSLIKQVFEHRNGQVEIDALFVEKRKGRDTLFIIEAKSGATIRSLSKHKLVYPILSVASHVSPHVDIVPIYMQVFKERDEYFYNILNFPTSF
ncbi:DUF6997 domain-containing protein [Anoxynatronum sibiricum]|uniref:DUF6997 domain-containing protein n=1 Tax=Anoxynatronum sibiricum TaxID=210623 RepID=A0ABU9VW95_9CLOT